MLDKGYELKHPDEFIVVIRQSFHRVTDNLALDWFVSEKDLPSGK